MGTKKMKYSSFIDKVVEEVKNKVGEQESVSVYPVKKNNNTTLDGLVITNPTSNISPTIYLNPYYCKYKGGHSFEEIIEDILATYEENRPTEDFNIETFRNFNIAKKTLIMKVVNTKRNAELLTTVPHRVFGNLAIVYYVLVTAFEKEFATILIHNEHLKLWGVTENQLYKAAMENTPALLPYRIAPLGDVLEDYLKKNNILLDGMSMYLLSNNKKIFGATTIMYDGLLKEIAEELEDNFYLIPSSVHEVLIIPESIVKEEYDWDKVSHLILLEKLAEAEYGECLDFTDLPFEKDVDKEKYAIKDMNKMIKEVNKAFLNKEEILEDYVYYFDGDRLICKK